MDAKASDRRRTNRTALPEMLVIRHGETQWNVEGRLQGHGDSPLTLNGVRQTFAVAATLHAQLPDLAAARLWVSPLGRARQTASILAGAWDIPFDRFQVEPALAERSFGLWEGLTLAEVEANFPQDFAHHARDPWRYAIAGGETRAAFTSRLENWLATLEPSMSHVLVVHSGCLRALRGIVTGADRETILAYREPQTTALHLAEGRERLIDIEPALLGLFGCHGPGRTVAI
ncbi:MAG: histidine phosphatase family protein [Fulvimarina manganoxydans]|nr:histidine phosphatase family protein [Fulvimarina manganoxydans]